MIFVIASEWTPSQRETLRFRNGGKESKENRLPIEYGDAGGVADFFTRSPGARNREVLAEGIVHAAKVWGLEDIAVHVKGLEPAGYDPRTLKGMGLAYATSDRGACHLRTTFSGRSCRGSSPRTPSRESGVAGDYEDRLNLFDALILCRFYRISTRGRSLKR